MKPELRERILAFNRLAAQRQSKAADLDVLLAAFRAIPTGQLKKVLTDDVIAVLEKYGLKAEKAEVDL